MQVPMPMELEASCELCEQFARSALQGKVTNQVMASFVVHVTRHLMQLYSQLEQHRLDHE